MNGNNKHIEKKPFLISICSGKGGVGKSVLSANLAEALSSLCNVLLWDADVFFPNQHLILGLEPPVRLNDVYAAKVPVEKAIYRINKNFGLLADMPAAGNLELFKKVDISSVYENISKTCDFDIIIMDTAAGGTYELLQSAVISDMICIVITDEPTSLLDAYALVKLLLPYIDTDKVKLLVNNVIDYEDANDVSIKLNLATDNFLDFQLEYIGYIPYSRSVRLSIIQQRLFINSVPDEEVTKAVYELAQHFYERVKNNRIVNSIDI